MLLSNSTDCFMLNQRRQVRSGSEAGGANGSIGGDTDSNLLVEVNKSLLGVVGVQFNLVVGRLDTGTS